MLISFANTKGGPGKSTLAAHLAIWLFDHGFRVALLDTDPQATSSEWVDKAEKGITVRLETKSQDIQDAIEELTATHDFVIADAPGEAGDAEVAVTMLSDYAIVPLVPNKVDVRALKGSLTSIRLAHSATQGRKPVAIIVLSKVRKRSKKTTVLKKQLRSSGHQVADSDVRLLDAIADACDTAAFRVDSTTDGAADLIGLFSELFGHLVDTKKLANE